MIIELLTWDCIEVECPDDPKLNEEFKNAYVRIGENSFPEGSLSIVESGYSAKPKSALYARGRLTSLSPEGFVAEAFYWSSTINFDNKPEKYWEKPVIIRGFF